MLKHDDGLDAMECDRPCRGVHVGKVCFVEVGILAVKARHDAIFGTKRHAAQKKQAPNLEEELSMTDKGYVQQQVVSKCAEERQAKGNGRYLGYWRSSVEFHR